MLSLIPLASYALEPYNQDFEGLTQSDPDALADDGWLVYGNVFTPGGVYIYGYGPFPAPNHSLAFSQIALGEGGGEQGDQVLSVFSDYENSDHANGNLIEANVYQEQTIGAADIGTTWCFKFQHKRGNIEGGTTALAFIKTLDPDNGYALTNLITVDMTSIPDVWGGDSLSIFIDETLENQLLQIGFASTATNYEGSGIFYDNLAFEQCTILEEGLQAYTQDFESLIQTSPTALEEDGWLVFGNVTTPGGVFLYNYGPFPAPNHNLGFCQIALGQGGPDQGDQVLSVFSDYENLDHGNGNLIESNVYQEQTIGAADVGAIWRFGFEHKRGNIEAGSTAEAFIKTLDPDNGFALTNFLTADMTSIPDTWGGDSLLIYIDPSLEGQLLQFGFSCTATNYEGSGIFYDNVIFSEVTGAADVPETPATGPATLGRNAPNPFVSSTRIEFALDQGGPVDLSVFDVNGRKVATLSNGDFAAGRHQAVWDGTADDGNAAPSGTYWYMLKTASGVQSGRMILTR